MFLHFPMIYLRAQYLPELLCYIVKSFHGSFMNGMNKAISFFNCPLLGIVLSSLLVLVVFCIFNQFVTAQPKYLSKRFSQSSISFVIKKLLITCSLPFLPNVCLSFSSFRSFIVLSATPLMSSGLWR